MGPSKEAAQRLRELRLAAGLTQKEAADLLGVDLGTVNRKEKGRTPATERDVLAAQRAYDSYRQAAQGEAAATGSGGSAGNETAPSVIEGAELAAELTHRAAKSVDYWIGRQEGLLSVMQQVAQLQRHVTGLQQQAAEMQEKAIATQREIMTHTSPTPVPESVLRQAALDHAREKQERDTARGGRRGRAEGA